MSNIKFLLFEMSAIEAMIRTQELQSYEFEQAHEFIKSICDGRPYEIEEVFSINRDGGLFFIGNKHDEKQFLIFDLEQCNLITAEHDTLENVHIVLQKSFRAAIRFWRYQPFTSSERVVHTKLIIFPFKYNMNGKQNKRLVLERQPGARRLTEFGINRPLLAYKYNDEDVPEGTNEVADINILEDASVIFLSILQSGLKKKDNKKKIKEIVQKKPFENYIVEDTCLKNEGFKYMQFEQKLLQLTEYQKKIVQNSDISIPIRVDGPAGTGKTMSLILRAYKLLYEAKKSGKYFSIVFFAHSESTRYEIEETFKMNEDADLFLEEGGNKSAQKIIITTLLEWCKNYVGFTDIQLTDLDASMAKEYQRLLIHDAYEKCYKRDYSTYAPHLSKKLQEILLPVDDTFSTSLEYMLQHEFSIQIKGRANSNLKEYKKLNSIPNGLPVTHEKDKEFIFDIYRDYQNYLDEVNQYDTDDVVIEAISRLNAPFWRRERAKLGYDYIFVDEMHLFNANEQYAFHYLTKDIYQTKVPICFALDYSQAIGDRGDVFSDYIENEIANGAYKQTYQTVFRSSQEITDFCTSIIASGTHVFESGFNNPYRVSVSGLSQKEMHYCKTPELYMYANDDAMIASIRKHISGIKKEFGSDCNNYEIAVISFVDELLNDDIAQDKIGRDFFYLKSRNASGLNGEVKRNNNYILSSPYNVNGLEFKCVILVGVDEGRVPQTSGTSDISANYLRYTALNQLYLCCSRAKYRVIILGNNLHGPSSCLNYSLETGTLANCNPV